jgi:DNA-binding transcriptional LysR family regulator
MDIRQIRQFLAVAETLSFSRGAERLHMAQPPLSMAIRRLEDELGAPLFIRGRRGVRLTDLGHSILQDARRLVRHAEQLRETALSVTQGTSGTLRVAFVGSATYSLLPRALPVFRARFPDVSLELREGTTSEILGQIRHGSLDLGLVRYPVFEAHAARLTVIQRDELVAVLPEESPLRGRKRLTLANLKEQPFVLYSSAAAANLRGQVLLACQAAGFVPKVIQEAVQVQTIISLVESGMGVALVPQQAARHAPEGVIFRRFTPRDSSLNVAIALASPVDGESRPAARFREVLQEIFR